MSDLPQRRRVLIMGAAGRDFHNFLCCYRDDPHTDVVAFTATQIPHIAGRCYPASLAGPSYPDGIPIYPETDLEALIATYHVDEVVFAYSDVANQTLMTIAQTVLAAGANFTLLGPHATMLSSQVPVIAVCAVRTGVWQKCCHPTRGGSPARAWPASRRAAPPHAVRRPCSTTRPTLCDA